jgi:hypothetical protein
MLSILPTYSKVACERSDVHKTGYLPRFITAFVSLSP